MNILDQLQADAITVKKVSSTKGGEYASPCPMCGGTDRFITWPGQGTNGRYFCRMCGKKGDFIQYLIDFKGMTFPEACRYSGNEHKFSNNAYESKPQPVNNHYQWMPKEYKEPTEQWQEMASVLILFALEKRRDNVIGKKMRSWLKNERCLTDDTIEKYNLGLLPQDYFRERSKWGLPVEIKEETGRPKKLWLPYGLVIPNVSGANVFRLRIRRLDPGKYSKYYIVPGSNMTPFYDDNNSSVAVVVESELDAMLLSQKLEDQAIVIGLGSAYNRPDKKLTDILRYRVEHILIALDTDNAGGKQCYDFWIKNFPNSSRFILPSKYGKDPTEAALKGLDLYRWFQVGLNIVEKKLNLLSKPSEPRCLPYNSTR